MNNREKDKERKMVNDIGPAERFRGGTIPWNKSLQESWKEVEARTRMTDTAAKKEKGTVSIKIRMGLWQYSAAAVIIILFALTSFMRFYSRSYITGPGENLAISLPDGSEVSLNAATTIRYNPLWWNISRKLSLEGEAYFDVVKGEVFEVLSSPGRTVVLGTSFNVLSRNGSYEVTCITGKVMVVAGGTGDEAILTPHQKAVLGETGNLKVDKEADLSSATAWKRGEFFFTSEPLDNVFSEIEIRYGISIDYRKKSDLIYTGYFKGENDIDTVMRLVCTPFGIKFEKVSEGVYRIIQDE